MAAPHNPDPRRCGREIGYDVIAKDVSAAIALVPLDEYKTISRCPRYQAK